VDPRDKGIGGRNEIVAGAGNEHRGIVARAHRDALARRAERTQALERFPLSQLAQCGHGAARSDLG